LSKSGVKTKESSLTQTKRVKERREGKNAKVDLQVTGRRYLVFGGTRGLGRAVAKLLSQEGAKVIVTGRTTPDNRESARSLPGVETWVLDTGDAGSISHFLEKWGDTLLDGLFVNTGGPPPGDFFDLSPEDWIQAFSQLLYGPVQLLKALSPKIADGGSVLFNTSSSIRVPIDHLFLSNVLRPAVEALAKGLSLELASRQIRVNVIAPGRIGTERVLQLDQVAATRRHLTLEEIQAQARAQIPLGRYGSPEEFARAAAFLLSPAAAFISGASLFVDGGQTKAL
jgi:3-oxoacyl-[acyl-carrier protein] reductase